MYVWKARTGSDEFPSIEEARADLRRKECPQSRPQSPRTTTTTTTTITTFLFSSLRLVPRKTTADLNRKGPWSALGINAITARSPTLLSFRLRRRLIAQLSTRTFDRRAMSGSRVCTVQGLHAPSPLHRHHCHCHTWGQTMPQRNHNQQTSPLLARAHSPTSARTPSRPSTSTL
jgi:hypothetical protein